jgi:hypothetical protein
MRRRDHDPQRLDTLAAPFEIGSIYGRHYSGRLLTLAAPYSNG